MERESLKYSLEVPHFYIGYVEDSQKKKITEIENIIEESGVFSLNKRKGSVLGYTSIYNLKDKGILGTLKVKSQMHVTENCIPFLVTLNSTGYSKKACELLSKIKNIL